MAPAPAPAPAVRTAVPVLPATGTQGKIRTVSDNAARRNSVRAWLHRQFNEQKEE